LGGSSTQGEAAHWGMRGAFDWNLLNAGLLHTQPPAAARGTAVYTCLICRKRRLQQQHARQLDHCSRPRTPTYTASIWFALRYLLRQGHKWSSWGRQAKTACPCPLQHHRNLVHCCTAEPSGLPQGCRWHQDRPEEVSSERCYDCRTSHCSTDRRCCPRCTLALRGHRSDTGPRGQRLLLAMTDLRCSGVW
jgi:hypothetical protein